MIFEKIKTISTSEELLDKAFRKAKRTFSGKKISDLKSKIDSYESMVLTASNIISDNLINIVKMFPSFKNIHPFYREMADLLVDLDKLKQALSKLTWASKKIHDLTREYIPQLRKSKTPMVIQKNIFGRISSITNSIKSELLYLNYSRNKLNKLPDINTTNPTVIVAGYPNVGKSSLVTCLTKANIKIDSYPFTTTNISIGHFSYNNTLYQIIDTPGLLDRPMEKRNIIELQSITTLKYLKAIILVLLDSSEICGYSIKEQLNLIADIKKYFNTTKVITVLNKQDILNEINLNTFDCLISTKTRFGINNLLEIIDIINKK